MKSWNESNTVASTLSQAMNIETIPVVVTNAKNRIAYNIVRSLGEKGIPVHTADFVSRSMSFSSTYSKGYFIYPSPFRDPTGFINCLIEKAKSIKNGVLIPVFEETFLVAKYKEELSRFWRFVIPDYEQVLTAHNKDRWEPIARKLGISVPHTISVEDVRKGSTTPEELRFPLLIKPKQGGGAWAITQINSATELDGLLAKDSYFERPWDRFFLQEKVQGPTHCVAMLFREGELRAKIGYKQLRDYPVTGGQATLRESVHNIDAENSLQTLLEELRWHGVCQADFIIEKETHTPYLIDLNPRFWGSLVQAIASGVDFPYLLYKIATEGDVDAVTTFKAGIVTRWIGGDLRTFLPSLSGAENKLRFISQFFMPKAKSTIYDDLNWNDPLPFCVWFFDAVSKMIKYRSLEPVAHDSLEVSGNSATR